MPDKPTRFAARRPPLALCGDALASCAVRTVKCSVLAPNAHRPAKHIATKSGARGCTAPSASSLYQMIDAD
eukprot:5279444-Pleurochrysis_carterae.AAC.1